MYVCVWFDAESLFLCKAEFATIITTVSFIFIVYSAKRRQTQNENIDCHQCPQILFTSHVWCCFAFFFRLRGRRENIIREDRLTHWVNIFGNLLRCLYYRRRPAQAEKISKPKHFIIRDKIFMKLLWELFTIKSNQDTFLMNAFIYGAGEAGEIFAMNNLFADARPTENIKSIMTECFIITDVFIFDIDSRFFPPRFFRLPSCNLQFKSLKTSNWCGEVKIQRNAFILNSKPFSICLIKYKY